MRLHKLDENLIGKKLGTALKTNTGIKIANSGAEISESILQRLNKYGFNAVYIEDDNVDIALKETIPETTRLVLMKKLSSIYDTISKSNEFDESELNRLLRGDLLPEIENSPVSIPFGIIAKDYDLAYHSINVCLLVLETGRNYGLDRDKLEIVAKAALLHDIGKILPDKYGERHEQKAYAFLKGITNSVLLNNAIRFHHETIDGKGPEKLESKYQNELVRILSLCNYYENLLTQKRLLPSECFENIQALTNFKFDYKAFDAFNKSIFVYPTGVMVKLSNGIEGLVVEQNINIPSRPVVKAGNKKYNLLEHLSLFVEAIIL